MKFKEMLEELRIYYSKEVSVDINTSQTAERIIRLAYQQINEKGITSEQERILELGRKYSPLTMMGYKDKEEE
ncbi:hypothetical protein AB7942_30010 [Neobacillus sp. BF23-41]|uniref:hypothetical protein n=1 Tax=Neobacillus sp. BF23-41 TaxID=3240280 RepID=UPI0034E4550B